MGKSNNHRPRFSALPVDRRGFLKSGIVLGACLPTIVGADDVPPKLNDRLGEAPQLFVDLSCVEKMENIKHVYHRIEKHPSNPILRKEKPWETLYGTWGTVIFDEDDGLFKSWYGGTGRLTGNTKPGFQKTRNILCYATSTDGVEWHRPELGLHTVAGTKQNNVVVGEDHHDGMDHWESVLKDPMENDPERRYKAIGWSSFDWNGPRSGIYTMTSPDGLRWVHSPEPVFRFHPRPGTQDLGPVGDAQSLMIDPIRNRYVAFLRTLPHRAFSESSDFVNWTPPKTCLKAVAGEVSNMVYNHQGFVYGDQYLGFLTYFDRDPVNPICTVRIITSRDGDSWYRPTSSPLIDVGEIGEPDRFLNMLTGGPPIRVGQKLYVYYRSLAVRHGPYAGKDDTEFRYPGGISLGTIRVDGFASVQASYDGGEVTTKPFQFSGNELKINAKADFGQLWVEVLDGEGNPVDGFRREDCLVIDSDKLNQVVRWKKQSDLSALRDQAIQLRFYLKNVRLYSYRITA